jgi:hypothetical protein
MVEVDGKKHITWEMQKKEGRHRALKAEVTKAQQDMVIIGAENAVEISSDGESYRQVIDEKVVMIFKRLGKGGYMLDLTMVQEPTEGVKVTIPRYRYSGFCWRGTPKWTGENSTMLSSGGHNRENANHQEAKWCMVSGDTPTGKATLLVMSAASKPERLRVWNSKMHHGNPFVNFNPVVKDSLQLKDGNEAVALRRYRLIMMDRELTADDADTYWQAWTK